MKRSRLLVLIFLLISATAAFAQSDSLQFKKHELGVDFLPLLNRDWQTSLIYRFHQQNAAWRVRVYGSYLQSFEDRSDDFYRNASIAGRLGREWHYDTRKLRFYYGLDLGIEYASSLNSGSENDWSETHERRLDVGIMPLLGFGYKINERFMLSTEVNGRIAGGRHWRWAKGWAGQRYSYIGFNALSDFALIMSYRF